jgi:tetratricopeptide (TPR) repeat protein
VTKRLEMLENLTSAGRADDFAWYALGLEYRSLGRRDDALRTFETLRQRSPGYLPMYLMAGQMLVEAGDAEGARGWLEAGIALARERGDQKALGELEAELAGAK